METQITTLETEGAKVAPAQAQDFPLSQTVPARDEAQARQGLSTFFLGLIKTFL